MATYTTQIKSIVESSNKAIFDFDYPIFDDEYRPVLESKIIDTYYFSEIGLETVEKFKHYLKRKLNIIMPYYNQLYETEGLVNKDNYNINLDNEIKQTRTTDQTSNGKSNSSSKNVGSSDSEDIYSDTPQGKLKGLDYATSLSDSKNNATSNTDANVNNETSAKTTDEYIETLLGNGSMRYNADILMEWRESFLNIDSMIIEELQDLFINIY